MSEEVQTINTEKANNNEVSTTSTKSNKSGKEVNIELIIQTLNNFAESKECPQWLKNPLQKQITPGIQKIWNGIEKAIPIVQKSYHKGKVAWDKHVAPYKPELLVPSLIGLIMCFFGGSFLTLIAAVEAFNVTASATVFAALSALYSDFQKVYEANNKDNERDDDGDGTPDVLQISQKELIQRKLFLFLKTVDPNRIMVAFGALNTGFLAIIAALKLEFAKTITLANAIYNAVEPPVDRFILPKFELLFPKDYKKWAKPILTSTIRSIIISWAWFLQRVISAFHSAIRGGLMFSRNLLEYLSKMGIYHVNHEDTYLDEAVGFGVALLGLIFQLSFRFHLPFPLNILLFPFSLAEWFLMWMVNTR